MIKKTYWNMMSRLHNTLADRFYGRAYTCKYDDRCDAIVNMYIRLHLKHKFKASRYAHKRYEYDHRGVA